MTQPPWKANGSRRPVSWDTFEILAYVPVWLLSNFNLGHWNGFLSLYSFFMPNWKYKDLKCIYTKAAFHWISHIKRPCSGYKYDLYSLLDSFAPPEWCEATFVEIRFRSTISRKQSRCVAQTCCCRSRNSSTPGARIASLHKQTAHSLCVFASSILPGDIISLSRKTFQSLRELFWFW